MATVRRPTEGTLELLGESMAGLSEHRALRRRIGYLQVPASLTAVLFGAVLVWALAQGGGGEPGKSGSAAPAVTAGAMMASSGLA
ncbi:hypothetical protein Y717_28005 [Streptomyces scopuliridis RB72]|uniref:Uncharacterized protein n=1 Tax=Streptomyces scopuliridis RB72 TaxID=1440053 RepID=A0A2T7TG20_9ACTN|nr:hypothetical protein Y717_28005 [Streptomyces scopuliridis RB72]